MLIVIISDSHDNIANIDKMLEYVRGQKIKVILHCGDVCAPSVLKYIAEKFLGDIYQVYGNVDGDHETMENLAGKLKNWHILGDEGSPKIKGVQQKIGMVHYPREAKEMANSGKYDIVFYGHNHKPCIEIIGNCDLVNPGTLAGLFQKSTFAVWDSKTGELELKITEII